MVDETTELIDGWKICSPSASMPVFSRFLFSVFSFEGTKEKSFPYDVSTFFPRRAIKLVQSQRSRY